MAKKPSKKPSNLKGDQEQSPKAHTGLPPKDLGPTHEVQGHSRGPAGQFTDKGAPGNQRY